MFAITRAFLSNAEAAFSAEDDVLPHKTKPGLGIKLPRQEAPHLERLGTRVLASPRSPGGVRERRPSSAESGEALPLVPYDVPVGEEGAVAITASEARKNLFPLIEQVNDDRQPVEITSKRGDAVLMSRVDYDALQETAYLLRVPANARRLLESLRQSLDGQREEHEIT